MSASQVEKNSSSSIGFVDWSSGSVSPGCSVLGRVARLQLDVLQAERGARADRQLRVPRQPAVLLLELHVDHGDRAAVRLLAHARLDPVHDADAEAADAHLVARPRGWSRPGSRPSRRRSGRTEGRSWPAPRSSPRRRSRARATAPTSTGLPLIAAVPRRRLMARAGSRGARSGSPGAGAPPRQLGAGPPPAEAVEQLAARPRAARPAAARGRARPGAGRSRAAHRRRGGAPGAASRSRAATRSSAAASARSVGSGWPSTPGCVGPSQEAHCVDLRSCVGFAA